MSSVGVCAAEWTCVKQSEPIIGGVTAQPGEEGGELEIGAASAKVICCSSSSLQAESVCDKQDGEKVLGLELGDEYIAAIWRKVSVYTMLLAIHFGTRYQFNNNSLRDVLRYLIKVTTQTSLESRKKSTVLKRL